MGSVGYERGDYHHIAGLRYIRASQCLKETLPEQNHAEEQLIMEMRLEKVLPTTP
jgi:hypothetical protein